MDGDVADGLLLDVRDLSLTDPDLSDESAFSLALDRVRTSNAESNYNSFGSSI